jgi:hypothetical protein
MKLSTRGIVGQAQESLSLLKKYVASLSQIFRQSAPRYTLPSVSRTTLTYTDDSPTIQELKFNYGKYFNAGK